jgi:hypothetical protein
VTWTQFQCYRFVWVVSVSCIAEGSKGNYFRWVAALTVVKETDHLCVTLSSVAKSENCKAKAHRISQHPILCLGSTDCFGLLSALRRPEAFDGKQPLLGNFSPSTCTGRMPLV